MRQSSRLLLGSAILAGSLVSSRAHAQSDVNPPPPNVLLLVDSSGSMEYKSSSNAFPTCDPTKDDVSEKSRWIDLVEVMTGSIDKYRCESVDRSSSGFKNLYAISGTDPADYYYTNPYHRPMSEKCIPTPGTLPVTAFDWPTDGIQFHKFDNLKENCDFKQQNDGLLDDGAFRKNVRFGLMTFDTDPDPKTGYSGTSANYANGIAGTWSYFLGSFKQGKPAACSTLQDQEVGARNAAAPPWEGRMVNFGPPTADPTSRNDRIQDVLLAVRPYGATPVAGMLDDARDFLWNDTTPDYVDGGDFGPKNDPYIAGGCRQNFVILLSDGEPNMDLRPHCEGAGPPAGQCPYDKPEVIAYDMANNPDPKKTTEVFVIGFAVSNVTLSNSTNVDCKNLSAFDLTNSSGLCAQFPNESQLQACCVLNRIAYNGGTNRAYFANDKDELRAAMSSILSGISASATSRTLPVFASSPGGPSNGIAGFRVYSSFKPVQFSLWQGILERQRVTCVNDPLAGTVTPTPQPLDKAKGDDFVWNVNSGKGPERMFWTVVGDKDNGKESDRSVRPNIGTTDLDGLGTESGHVEWDNAANFAAHVPPEALNIKKNDCTKGVSDSDCRDRVVNWLTGEDKTSDYSRCPSAGSCNLVADIYHSTPRVVSRPVEFLRDESYTLYSLQQAKRHTMLYTSTNDGFFHGFKMASGDPATDTLKVDTDDNNELWAFIPPAVLLSIKAMYPPTHQSLLDGVPVVQDVIAIDNANPPPSGYPFRFERAASDAQAGAGKWRTIMVQAFGGNRGGYFAMDITDPVVPTSKPDPTKGPQFLWQLTEAKDGKPLFGRNGVTPLITTLYFNTKNDGTTDPKEVAVAVLPGGDDPDGPETGKDADRKNTAWPNVDSRYPPRTKVPKYKDGDANQAARSLTVVRLDTGEIVQTFWAKKDKAPVDDKRRTEVKIDSPITGTPVAFPGTTGAVSDRIFVGDRDGTVWRLDVSNLEPKKWDMSLFFDLYSGKNYDEGQPIQTPPVLSVDLLGSVTMAVSTGDQDVLLGQAGMKNSVWSITEKLNGTNYESEANWYSDFDDGERVTGPMSLFNGGLYFTTYEPESPSSGQACGQGASRVWGVDYLLPKTPGPSDLALRDGGKERMPNGASFVQYLDNTASMLANAGIIFGVGVSQLPSCTTEDPNIPDQFMGTGTHTSITNITPGKFQLVMQVSGTGNTADNSQTKRVEIDLPTPPSTSRIDSWAAIVE
jgi:type IV pilus assembly protein PilY1